MSTPTTSLRPTHTGVLVVLFLLLLAACSPGGGSDATPVTDEINLAVRNGVEASRTPDETQGSGERVVADYPATAQIVFEEADERGHSPFVADAVIAECRPEELISTLVGNDRVGAAWADAAGVAHDDVAETIRSYSASVLTADTRVTNHAYLGGTARAFQATLEAGTAVLVDEAGVPRVRCACGNPLAPPQQVIDGPEQTPAQAPVPTTTVPTTTVPTQAPTPQPLDFCATWDAVRPEMIGGPTSPDEAGMTLYFDTLVAGFDQLLVAADATPGFPADARADIFAYRNAIATADPASPGPAPEDALVGVRVQDFLLSYCGDEASPDTSDDTPDITHVEPPVDEGDESTPADGRSANCGSMQFALLVMAAEDLGVAHSTTSQPYIDAMLALVNGADPGPEFDVGDLSLMLANEEIGCQGAQAVHQLLIDEGYGPIIEGSDLDSGV